MEERITKTEKNLFLSFIVPVYNVEKYLRDCLDSLLMQNVEQDEYEIICVNDGSTDGSLAILREYENANSCIRVIHQENAGHAAARNVGLKEAKGNYVWFVDSDDVIDYNALAVLFKELKEKELDECCVNYRPIEMNYNGDLHKKGVNKLIVSRKKSQLSCSGIRIFNRTLLTNNHITWDDRLSPCDDIKFVFQVNKFKKKSIHIKNVFYYHRQRADSASHVRSIGALQKRVQSFLLLADYYNEELQNLSHSKKERRNIECRRNLCAQAILMALISLDQTSMEQYLQALKDKKYYPYKTIKWNLLPKISIKRTLTDYAIFLFPKEKYYLWFYKKFHK